MAFNLIVAQKDGAMDIVYNGTFTSEFDEHNTAIFVIKDGAGDIVRTLTVDSVHSIFKETFTDKDQAETGNKGFGVALMDNANRAQSIHIPADFSQLQDADKASAATSVKTSDIFRLGFGGYAIKKLLASNKDAPRKDINPDLTQSDKFDDFISSLQQALKKGTDGVDKVNETMDQVAGLAKKLTTLYSNFEAIAKVFGIVASL